MNQPTLTLLLICTALLSSGVAQAAGRPLGPPKSHSKAVAVNKKSSAVEELRQAQLRIERYQKINIPNLPGSNPGPAPSTLGRPYSQEELTRSWAPYTYP
jgi:hypothetical protein